MKSYIFTILTLLAVPFTIIAQNVEFEAKAPGSVVAGNRFQLVYSNNQSGNDLRVPDMPDFQVLMGPTTTQRSQVEIINGNVSRKKEIIYTYILKASTPGSYTIPPATIEVDGKKYESNKLTIEVLEAGEEPESSASTGGATDGGGAIGDDDLFINMTVNKKNVYQSEPVLLTTKIFTRVNLEGISDIHHPTFRSFIAEDLINNESIQWSVQNVDGKNYRVGTYNQKIIFPQKSGTQKVEPTSIEFLVRLRQTRQSSNIFDNFFDSHRTVKKTVTSQGVSLNVKPLPTPRPAIFSGFVGQLDLNVSASKNKVQVNDGITIKTIISGTGNLKVASAPSLNIPPDFDEFDPDVSNNLTTTARGIKGSKTFEQLIIPRHSGTFQIPAVEYSYFDSSIGQYRTLRGDPITIEVESAGGDETSDETTSQISGPARRNRESVQFLGQDIRYIKTSSEDLQPINTFFFGSWQFLVGYVGPFLLFLIISIIYRKKIKENSNLQLKKTKRANKIAQKRLKVAARQLKAGNNEAFYEELSKGLWGYLSDKLAIAGAELTRDNVRQVLEKNGAQSGNTERLLEILDNCEYARYAPAGEESQRENLYEASIEVISKLENNLKRKNQ